MVRVKIADHNQASVDQIVKERVAQAQAEVLAACVHYVRKRAAHLDNITCNILADELLVGFQPAASALEELLDKAHEAALPHAAKQLLKSLTPAGGDFAVGSPLAKVKKQVEELLRKEGEEALLGIVAWRRDLLEAWRTDSRAWMTVLLEGGPNMDIEKARASEGRG